MTRSLPTEIWNLEFHAGVERMQISRLVSSWTWPPSVVRAVAIELIMMLLMCEKESRGIHDRNKNSARIGRQK